MVGIRRHRMMRRRIHAAVQRRNVTRTQALGEFIEGFATRIAEDEVEQSESIARNVVHFTVVAQHVQGHWSIEIVKDTAKFRVVEDKV